MPGPLEAAEGGAPETVTHKEETPERDDELSPEEQAVHVNGSANENPDEYGKEDEAGEDSETAALAEGRGYPPTGTHDEPKSPSGSES